MTLCNRSKGWYQWLVALVACLFLSVCCVDVSCVLWSDLFQDREQITFSTSKSVQCHSASLCIFFSCPFSCLCEVLYTHRFHTRYFRTLQVPWMRKYTLVGPKWFISFYTRVVQEVIVTTYSNNPDVTKVNAVICNKEVI